MLHCQRLVMLGAIALLVAACGESTSPSPGDAAGSNTTGRYTIAVDAFAGIGHNRLAERQADDFARQTNLDGFWVDSDGLESYVHFGRYPAADDGALTRDKKKLEQLSLAGRFRPRMIAVRQATDAGLEGAGLTADTGPARAHDLRNAHPEAIYTLQVAIWDADFRGDRKQAAEQEAARLRSEGYNAYFYHGPRDSLVTIDAYAQGAYRQINEGGQIRNELHPHIQKLRERDGMTWLRRNGKVIELKDDRTGELVRVETGLVRIPLR